MKGKIIANWLTSVLVIALILGVFDCGQTLFLLYGWPLALVTLGFYVFGTLAVIKLYSENYKN